MLPLLSSLGLLHPGTRWSIEQGCDRWEVVLPTLSLVVHAKCARGHFGLSLVTPPLEIDIRLDLRFLFHRVLWLQIRTTPLSRLVHHLLFIELLGLVATRNPSLHYLTRWVATRLRGEKGASNSQCRNEKISMVVQTETTQVSRVRYFNLFLWMQFIW